MDDGSDNSSPAKGLAKDLDTAGSGQVGYHLSILSSFLTMYSSFPCLLFALQTISLAASMDIIATIITAF